MYTSFILAEHAKIIAGLEKDLAKVNVQAIHTGVLVVPAKLTVEAFIIKVEERRQTMLLEKEESARLNGL